MAKTAGGYGICNQEDTSTAAVFRTVDDPDYRALLKAIQTAADHLDKIKRFDMPGFKPRAEYVREMRRFGILQPELETDAAIDVYSTDRAYWKSLTDASRRDAESP